ncbi:hypothetical protein TNIN_386041 [Trichonephila inaurata madagascariensis]|uniref:Uncharacterized protein n=1 Tax=Trichonephila inaurata madagascariensis TaxID=2747483 RepID=A0A8X6XUF7_9ARAC|nr:hypothetical protein TNIN_386041 [Trichonephila inaurata madagascariensis]
MSDDDEYSWRKKEKQSGICLFDDRDGDTEMRIIGRRMESISDTVAPITGKRYAEECVLWGREKEKGECEDCAWKKQSFETC